MTSKDIEQAQIILTTKNGEHIMTISNDNTLINMIATMCKFYRLNDELFEQYSLKELIVDEKTVEEL